MPQTGAISMKLTAASEAGLDIDDHVVSWSSSATLPSSLLSTQGLAVQCFLKCINIDTTSCLRPLVSCSKLKKDKSGLKDHTSVLLYSCAMDMNDMLS